jgi:hypothetical protein
MQANVICTCVNSIEDGGAYLRSLLRTKLTVVHQKVTWIDHQSTGVEISPDHKYVSKVKSNNNWDKICRSTQRLTKGRNILEFKVTKLKDPTSNDTGTAMVVGVHPNPYCVVAACEPGFHVSSVGVAYHAYQVPERQKRKSATGYDTFWMANNIIRVEVDFIEDRILIFCNEELKMENEESHKPSSQLEWYFTFMFCSPNVQIEILSSSIAV